MQGRLLTIVAMYFWYTRDAATLAPYLPKLAAAARMLLGRHAAARAAFAPEDPRYGMPTGNDEADLWWCSADGGRTELSYISIAAEAWRGMRDGGAALHTLSAVLMPTHPHAAALARNLSAEMTATAPAMLTDLRTSMRRSAFHEADGTVCHPYVAAAAGNATCGELSAGAADSSRASEAWRTYAEALYSGAIEPGTTSELLEWHQHARCAGHGSRLKLGVLTGSGLDVSNGDVLETFTLFGWGYGLLQADLIAPFLLQYFAVAAHGYTRGTWIAPESSYVDRTRQSPSFATPAGLVAPLYLKWTLVWEDPMAHVLWLGRACPRAWLEEGESIVLDRAPTAYGRLGMRVVSAIRSRRSLHVNLTIPQAWAFTKGGSYLPPPGGLSVRLRVPGAQQSIQKVIMGGKAWAGFNSSGATIEVPASSLATQEIRNRLADVWVVFGDPLEQ